MKKRIKGFTLVELIICIAIIAILVSIAVPQYTKARASAICSAHNSNVQTIKSAAIMAEMDSDATDLKSEVLKYLDGNELPEINKDIPGYKSGWSITKDGNGNIIISPGLMKVENGKITPKN